MRKIFLGDNIRFFLACSSSTLLGFTLASWTESSCELSSAYNKGMPSLFSWYATVD